MQSIPNVDGWLDAVVVLAAVMMTSIPSWFAIKAHRSAEAVKSQVVNGHKEPMRSDLDRAIAAIDQLGHEVRGIRQDMISEEQRRRSHIDELRQDVDRRFHELQKRIH